MQLDSMTRGLLAFVLALTLLLLVQRLVLPMDRTEPVADEMDSEVGRYAFWFRKTRTTPLLFRVDKTTGAVWKRRVEENGPWHRLNDAVVVVGTRAARPYENPIARGRKRRSSNLGQLGVVPKKWRKAARRLGVDAPEDAPKDLSVLIDVVRNGQPVELRPWAFDQIVNFPAKDSVPALASLLRGASAGMQLKIISVLKEKGDPAAIEPLRELANSSDKPRVKHAAEVTIEALEADAKKPAV